MKVGDYLLNCEETSVVNNVFNGFKKMFPDTELREKSDIVGIGEPNRHLMCYFIVKDNILKIKFKNDPEYYDLNDDLQKNIDATIVLFQTEDFTIKKKSRNANKNNDIDSEQSEAGDIDKLLIYNQEKPLDVFSDNKIGFEGKKQKPMQLTNEEYVFLKILLQKIDPLSGEVINISDDTISTLRHLLNKLAVIKVVENKVNKKTKEIIPIQLQQKLVEGYINGKSLAELLKESGIMLASLKKVLVKHGVAPKVSWIKDRYVNTLVYIDKNKHKLNVGKVYTQEED